MQIQMWCRTLRQIGRAPCTTAISNREHWACIVYRLSVYCAITYKCFSLKITLFFASSFSLQKNMLYLAFLSTDIKYKTQNQDFSTIRQIKEEYAYICPIKKHIKYIMQKCIIVHKDICSGQSVAGLDKSRRFIPICPTALHSAPVKFLQGESYICLHLAKKVIITVTNNFAITPVKICHIFQFTTPLKF